MKVRVTAVWFSPEWSLSVMHFTEMLFYVPFSNIHLSIKEKRDIYNKDVKHRNPPKRITLGYEILMLYWRTWIWGEHKSSEAGKGLLLIPMGWMYCFNHGNVLGRLWKEPNRNSYFHSPTVSQRSKRGGRKKIREEDEKESGSQAVPISVLASASLHRPELVYSTSFTIPTWVTVQSWFRNPQTRSEQIYATEKQKYIFLRAQRLTEQERKDKWDHVCSTSLTATAFIMLRKCI